MMGPGSATAASTLALMDTLSTAMVPIEVTTRTPHKMTRKSRWERAPRAAVYLDGDGSLREEKGPGIVGGGRRKRKSRWGPVDRKTYLPPPYTELPVGVTPEQIDQFFREQRLEELDKKLFLGELELGDPDLRAPSPPPVYDKDGSRMNTLEVRVRMSMMVEHQRLIDSMKKKVIGYVPPAEYKPVKRIRRIMIPQNDFPEYNFMGLIIGPRGCNHKKLEAESGAQISIRGRGTQKEGKRSDHQSVEEAAMPQHVHIAADSDDKLERAVALIEPLLDPSHPVHEEYKKRGLEQLAIVNGTGNFVAKSEARCTVCGAVGHFGYECPDAQFDTYKMAEVKCLLCGDRGHVTMDCKLAREQGLTPDQIGVMEAEAAATKRARQQAPAAPPTPSVVLPIREDGEKEYARMMNELGVGAPPPPPMRSEAAVATSYMGARQEEFGFAKRPRSGLSFGAEEPLGVLSQGGYGGPPGYMGRSMGGGWGSPMGGTDSTAAQGQAQALLHYQQQAAVNPQQQQMMAMMQLYQMMAAATTGPVGTPGDPGTAAAALQQQWMAAGVAPGAAATQQPDTEPSPPGIAPELPPS